MARRVKDENAKRVVVSFSISDEINQQLTRLRTHLKFYMGSEPTVEDIRSFARGKAQAALEEYLNEPLVPDPEWEEE